MSNQIKAENLCVVCNEPSRQEQANNFAALYQLPLEQNTNSIYELQLIFDLDKIELFDNTLKTSIHVDFLEGSLAHRKKFGGGKNQPLAKAIGLNKIKKPTVIDATAGLAGDAYVLATLGCQLTLIEQSPILYTLIKDGIKRALDSENTEHCVNNFTNLIHSNSLLYLESMAVDSKPDVIYIDPMYPDRKKSALVKKDMQILHKLIGSSIDEEELLQCALLNAKRRVVVKRPIQADTISGIKPTMAISSKKTRYDVYVLNQV